MGRTKGPLFTKEDENLIIELMKKYKRSSSPFVNIRKEMLEVHQKDYSPKQIRQRYINHLKPGLCHDVLDENKKSFIIRWVENNKKSDGTIHWKELISAIESEFGGKKYSENKVKNFWYLKQRSQVKPPSITFSFSKVENEVINRPPEVVINCPPEEIINRPPEVVINRLPEEVITEEENEDMTSSPSPSEDEYEEYETPLQILCKVANYMYDLDYPMSS